MMRLDLIKQNVNVVDDEVFQNILAQIETLKNFGNQEEAIAEVYQLCYLRSRKFPRCFRIWF